MIRFDENELQQIIQSAFILTFVYCKNVNVNSYIYYVLIMLNIIISHCFNDKEHSYPEIMHD